MDGIEAEDAGWNGIGHLRPTGDGFRREPFERWFARVQSNIQHVPKCVAEQWLHRHWGYSPYHWLPIADLRFQRQAWGHDAILRIGEGEEPRWSPCWPEQLGVVGSTWAEMWLGKHMVAHGTWPVPIIVLDNVDGLKCPFGEPLARIHLIEGHMRSAFIHHLIKTGKAKVDHDVWVATLTARAPPEPSPPAIPPRASSTTPRH